MTFSTQSAAKRFFVEKIVAQAESEGTPLSKTERDMLSFSESDPEFVIDPVALSSQLNEEETDDEYEAKIAGLIKRSFRKDAASDSRSSQQWYEARSVLAQGDHYLLIMIARGLAEPPVMSGRAVGISVSGNSVRIVLGTLAVLIGGATALTAVLVAVVVGPAREQIATFVVSILLFASGTYLIRSARTGGTS